MKKIITLPAPQLSQLKQVHIDVCMTGRHFAELAVSEGQIPEDVALSIVSDLMEEDAGQLTMSELRYLFMLVKINSLENDYTATIECTHEDKLGKVCGHHNTIKILLSDSDLNNTPKNYKVPTISFATEEGEKLYKVLPPTMKYESALLNDFVVRKNCTLEQLAEDKRVSMDYTFKRACMHLVDNETDERLVTEDMLADFNCLDKYLDMNPYPIVSKLYKLMVEVGSYGVQNKLYQIKCEECGGSLVFRLPLLHGLSDQY